ncbi:hypothetical protein PILCRDRAFT_14346 [Piloderma croceum F 1598]|uniref:Uncharacterized protein n=1 Tax=Piloderma croceum (strain F 1598) TaxID=765440 RepID=A0A0C3F3G2_PILCF|nr:hypothetical protein PILCRDRAFT_14346 [Piloderma croceum F 1598]
MREATTRRDLQTVDPNSSADAVIATPNTSTRQRREVKGSVLCYLQNEDVRGDGTGGDGMSGSLFTRVEVTPAIPSSIPALLTLPFHTGARIPVRSRSTSRPQSQLEQLIIARNGKTYFREKTGYPGVGVEDH